MDNVSISYMTTDDLNSITNILKTDFDDFWNENILKSDIENENTFVLTAKFNNIILGFISIWKAYDIMHINNIVVGKKYRNQKIGSLLLEEAIKITTNENVNELTLEVSENNIPAISLYKKFGFKEIGIRKNYYGQNNNAIIMSLYINRKI